MMFPIATFIAGMIVGAFFGAVGIVFTIAMILKGSW